MKITTGVFLSDLHAPYNVNLDGVFAYVRDIKPAHVIFGGDVIDADGLHAAESMRAEQVDVGWFDRDVALLKGILGKARAAAPNARLVFLCGNHEQRYDRLQVKYPHLFAKVLDLKAAIAPLVDTYVPYGTNRSYFRLGDTVFTHGDIWPDAHAKAYASRFNPYKIVYGHLHHFQAYTTHRALVNESPRYAVTGGCLSSLNPAWKKGVANQWVNGFVTFWTDGQVTVPTPVLIERGRFVVGGKRYESSGL